MDTLSEIQQQIFAKRPVLQEIIEQYQELPLQVYIDSAWEIGGGFDAKFLEAFRTVTANIFGAEVAKQATTQLTHTPLVSTIEHHGIWNQPIFVNSSLIYSLKFSSSEFAIALSTESVSLNNRSSFSASITTHEGGRLNRYSLLPDKVKMSTVFSAPTITLPDLERFSKRVPKEVVELVGRINIDVTKSNFSQQASLATYNFWQLVFPSAPKLLYVPLESVILKYLEAAIKDPNNLFYKLLCTPVGAGVWEKYFSTEHTYMFWGVDRKGRREVLESVTQDVDELVTNMRLKKIYPSSPLCFMVLLACGITCVGGFTQTTWLTHIKQTFLLALQDLGHSSGSIEKVPTKNFAESILALLHMQEGLVSPAAANLYFAGGDRYDVFKSIAQKITLGETFRLALPAIYEVVVPHAEQNPEFLTLSFSKQLVEGLEYLFD